MTMVLKDQSSIQKIISTEPGINLSCHIKGDGDELIVFLHAVGSDYRNFAPQVEEFSKSYTTVTFDMRGHGQSKIDEAEKALVNIEQFGSDVISIIDELGFSSAHLVGSSMGGVVALEAYMQNPGAVQSITMANSWCYVDNAEERIAFIEEQLSNKSMSESAKELVPSLFAETTDKKIVEIGVNAEASKDKEVFLASWRSMFKCDYRDWIGQIYCPLLLVSGAKDPVTSTSLLSEIHSRHSLSRLVNLPNASHFSNLDCPGEFNAHLKTHLLRARGKSKMSLENKKIDLPADTVAQGLMSLLNQRGVEYFFSNSGTDFTPIADALGRYSKDSDFKLQTVVAPHENTAIAMAHGYYLLSGRPQATMAHVSVGTANMGLGIINASRSRIPVLVMSGKTPWYDYGVEGCRTNFVQWGQDTFDQGGYFREYTKWDYELKGPLHLETVVDRALAISMSDPQGPVYLTLPKEALCMAIEQKISVNQKSRQKPSLAGACGNAQMEFETAKLLLRAKNPVVVTAELGRYKEAVEQLVALSDRFAIGVIEHGKRNFFNFPTEHPMHLGYNPQSFIKDADVVVVLESHVPWIPDWGTINENCKVIQIGVDPLCQNLPMRAFPVDINLAGNPALVLTDLNATMYGLLDDETQSTIDNRRKKNADVHKSVFETARSKAASDAKLDHITKNYISYCVGQAIDDDVVIFNEYNLDPTLVPRRQTMSWFENSIASGLGWSLGAALGAQLASPEQVMMVTLGDGSYLFNTPMSAHYVAGAYNLPIVIVVFNDSGWSTIKKSYDGTSSPANDWANKNQYGELWDFKMQISFEKIAESCNGIGIKVDKPKDLLQALKQAIEIARKDKKHVLVNAICVRDY
ncbi:thiamine pyrophosphate-requiring protein [bacterium]|nr:thiamine pyrophosphate-requiring protein [bacterium]